MHTCRLNPAAPGQLSLCNPLFLNAQTAGLPFILGTGQQCISSVFPLCKAKYWPEDLLSPLAPWDLSKTPTGAHRSRLQEVPAP